MARKIKFALEMSDGTFVSVLEDLQGHIKNNDDVKKLVEYFLDGRLEKWLLDRYHEEEAKALQAVDKDDPDFALKLCKAIGVDYTPSDSVNIELIEYEKKMRKALEDVTDDIKIIENAGSTASNQAELDFLIKNGKKTIYLWGDSFNLFVVKNISYIGILGKPSVDIDLVDLDAVKNYGIKFENVNLPERFERAEKEVIKKVEKELLNLLKSEEEARRKAEEESRRKSEEEARRKAEEEARKRTEEEAKRKAEEERRNSNPFKNAKVGDYIKFGSYPQTADGRILPIEWQVLAKKNNKMLLNSKYGLEARRFDSSSNNWEKSEIRQWLNGEFYNKSFDENERKLIIQSIISTAVYKKYEELGFFQRLFSGQKEGELGEYSELTDDYIFLLSAEELKYVKELRCWPTEYVIKNDDLDRRNDDLDRSRIWWLRSPNPFFDGKSDVNCVSHVGFIMQQCSVYNDYPIVRPAMWINI